MAAKNLSTAILPLSALFAIEAASQSPPPSALINQRADETVEAARAAAPHTRETAYAYFQDEAEEAIARAIERVWDPSQPYPEPPRMSWGDPDLTGYWLNSTYTPLERPGQLEGKRLYTPQEAIEAFQIAVKTDASVDPATVHYDWTEFGMDYWQSPVRPNLRTSLIVDPPDGRIPDFTSAGLQRSREQTRGHTLESRGLYERCIQGNQGPPRTPHARGGNSDFGQSTGQSQIIQTPDNVVLITQANSDVRIFPLGDSPHASDAVRSYLGDSRAHWEGYTLVVETTNFHENRKWQGSDRDLHLVERFTRVAGDTLLYEARITDPTTWVGPWSIEVPWPMLDPPGMYEFACHEQNYGIINVVRGAQMRAAEYEAGLEP